MTHSIGAPSLAVHSSVTCIQVSHEAYHVTFSFIQGMTHSIRPSSVAAQPNTPTFTLNTLMSTISKCQLGPTTHTHTHTHPLSYSTNVFSPVFFLDMSPQNIFPAVTHSGPQPVKRELRLSVATCCSCARRKGLALLDGTGPAGHCAVQTVLQTTMLSDL